jgi:alpha-tubulin suppressor-like RCC1 family protein
MRRVLLRVPEVVVLLEAVQDDQFLDGRFRPGATPATVKGLSGVPTAVAAGYGHTCALSSEGAVECWGANDQGQVGNATTSRQPVSAPARVLPLGNDVLAIALGARHSCALTRMGAVTCWGANEWGQLGDGSTAASATPVQVNGLSGPAVAITTGQNHTCAVLLSGDVQCWGWNYFGQLGDGLAPASGSSIPASVLGFG